MANKKEDYSILRYCAKSLNPNVTALNKAAQQILKRNDIEDIHDLRVASRRIRSVLDAFKDHIPNRKFKAWQKDISAITKTFGAVRDLDVQLSVLNDLYKHTEDKTILPGLRRIKLRIEQKRKAKQANTVTDTQKLLESDTVKGMNDWLEAVLSTADGDDYYSSGLFQLGYQQIQKRLDEFLFYEVFIFDAQRVEELHAMRITAKQLRYSLEIFSALYKKETEFALKIAKQAQEYLGAIHDCDVWIAFLPRFLEKEFTKIKEFYGYTRPYRRIRPGIEFFIENRRKERDRIYKVFLNNWKNWKLQETWLNLRKVIFLTSLETQSNPPLIKSLKEEEIISGGDSSQANQATQKENSEPGEDKPLP